MTVVEAKVSNKAIIANACLMPFLIGFLTILGPLIAKLSDKLSHDDKRVRGKTGLLSKTTMDSPIKRVGGVSVEQGIIGWMLNLWYSVN